MTFSLHLSGPINLLTKLKPALFLQGKNHGTISRYLAKCGRRPKVHRTLVDIVLRLKDEGFLGRGNEPQLQPVHYRDFLCDGHKC